MKKALTIAGSDSGGGAGIQQDLKVFSSLGVYGASAITAVTAQNTLGVQDYEALSPQIVSAQIDSVLSDIKPDAAKTGMLATAEIIEAVEKQLKKHKFKNLVVDPVMASTSGHRLLDEDAVESMKKLCSYAILSTPNIPEAEILSGVEIKSRRDIFKAAEEIGDCLIKGGHRDCTDYLFFGGETFEFKAKHIVPEKIHGTGCALSAAITAYLARGFSIPVSVEKSKSYLDEVLARAYKPGKGFFVLDSAQIKYGRTYFDDEKRKAVENIEEAINLFVENPNTYKLIPRVGANIVMALPKAKKISEVAGLGGKIINAGGKSVAVGTVDFGNSHHIARVLLTAKRFDNGVCGAVNIKYGEEIIDACRKLKYSVEEFCRDSQPKDAETVEYGTLAAIKKRGKVPDIVFDCGGMKKEAIVRVFGLNATDAVAKALKITEKLK